MLVTIGSVSNLKKGKMEDVEIHAVFKNLDFLDTEFEKQLAEGLQKIKEEVLIHCALVRGQTSWSHRRKSPLEPTPYTLQMANIKSDSITTVTIF